MFEDWSWFLLIGAFFLMISILTLVIITLVNVLKTPSVTTTVASRDTEQKSTAPDLSETIDVVISLGPKDLDVIQECVTSVVTHCSNLNKIYIVSAENPNIDKTTWVDEKQFPFTKTDLNTLYNIPMERCGWYLQQLIKLYAGSVIPDLQEHYLVWDADTILLRDTTFVNRNRALFGYSDQYHAPYFAHMQRLSPFLTREATKSGICNYMVFNRSSLKRLFLLVQGQSTEPFWKLFLKAVDPAEYVHSGASEFEIYFNYMHRYEPEKFVIRHLDCLNNCSDPATLTDDQKARYDMASCHWYLRKQANVLGNKH